MDGHVRFSRLEACDSINFVDMKKSLAWITSVLKGYGYRCLKFCMRGSRKKTFRFCLLLVRLLIQERIGTYNFVFPGLSEPLF